MELIKIKQKNSGAIKEVKKTLVNDYLGTGDFELYIEPKEDIKEKPIEKKPSGIKNKK